ncbi:MAG: DNA-binding protein [Erysipelotrichales bacterium]|nr:DNA-binding protein [Erysipelotrichales bacterium]MBQ1385522.1 DNA-binding protein [Erysipelotrichales bacterium]MBQ4375415.1 DNA-binding protein [Erysipelotrichales bacterium]
MRTIVFRLTEGMDLRKEIEETARKENARSGAVISAVGCLKEISLRLAGAEETLHDIHDYEVVSLTGTVSENGAHLHIAVSDVTGRTFGGHLKYGNIVNSTMEIVYLAFDDIRLRREMDPQTGYNELVIAKRTKED